MIHQATLILVMLTMLLTLAACQNTTSCGDMIIPFPFGTNSNCSLDDSFLITCNHDYNPPKPFLNSGRVEIIDISLDDGLMRIASSVASDCYDSSGSQVISTISELSLIKFSISSARNMFMAVGCDTYALVEGSKGWNSMSAGCVSFCDSIESVVNNTCSGVGCCQTSIPKGVKDFLVDIRSFKNHTKVRSFNPCGYAFVVEDEAFKFTSSDLKDLGRRKSVPFVLEWSVGNVSCDVARRDISSFACRADQSACSDSSDGVGYRCKCSKGFEGNPYIIGGCQDINECVSMEPCEGTCTNLEGSYLCSCPNGFDGDGKKDGDGCHSKSHTNSSTIFYIASGFMVPAVGSSWIFWGRKQKKVVKLRRGLFISNGGKLLEDIQCSQKRLKVFTAEAIKNATKNYHELRILRREAHLGFIYEGILPDGIVAIHICNELGYDDSDIKLFINRITNLSHIIHRNVVKLIGCCLETQVPILVYQFVTNKTLYDYIHDDDLARSLSWKIRLKIAKEIASALVYMHSDSQVEIIHGRLSSSSVLLNNGYEVKLCDFSLSLSPIAIELGYMDPEYFISQRLTTKSDVYSFGIVLAELLTGKDAICRENLVREGSLAQVFVSLSRQENVVSVLDDRLKTDCEIEQLREVAKLTGKCLSDNSYDRPTMIEVALALENVISKNSSSTMNVCSSLSQGTTARRVVRRNRSF